ncbi:class I SAM-dependent methyltransferase [Tenacibaculum sp. AHE15PA]|uniref:class I SAM-dependent methyltransferase n=1 Tax=unclassified Tenacibaculum TaxID=2635139 RepID=UPI001C4E972E|nr:MULTISPECIES: class I SAM-dependent methyltransferase [unclassified Tenacibaculum]QXP73977.1 class I SAM-dependent methyltransferase [Tenacibaculum sp. AHE14PA]QXP75656.1 class I SAM-dependent methyltransferase [Tenacibaculum sp. AHE15PA]
MNNKEKSLKKNKTPWPTKKAMDQVYEMKLWGTNNAEFYSGDGSHQSNIVIPYIDAVTSFLTSFKDPITVCDLGCGDFNIGKQLMQYAKKYIAVDIVSDLITYNKERFKETNLEFQCLDIAVDNLPYADCVIVRQVLQHLSNNEVQNVVKKLSNFKYVVLTEHLPEGDFIPNKDIISGQGIRLKKQSGLNLLEPPFNFKVKAEKELVTVVLDNKKGIIKTKLFRVF